jgi:hypothetical protein
MATASAERESSRARSRASAGSTSSRDTHAYWLLPEGGQRRTRLPSVTGILGDTWSDRALLEWYMREPNARELRDEGRRAARTRTASSRPTCATGELLPFSDFEPQRRPYIQGAARFIFEHDPQPVEDGVERLVCHPELRYAGRLDLLAILNDSPALTLLDYKTNPKGNVYAKAHVQLIGYAVADRRCGGEPVERCAVVGLTDQGDYRLVRTPDGRGVARVGQRDRARDRDQGADEGAGGRMSCATGRTAGTRRCPGAQAPPEAGHVGGAHRREPAQHDRPHGPGNHQTVGGRIRMDRDTTRSQDGDNTTARGAVSRRVTWNDTVYFPGNPIYPRRLDEMAKQGRGYNPKILQTPLLFDNTNGGFPELPEDVLVVGNGNHRRALAERENRLDDEFIALIHRGCTQAEVFDDKGPEPAKPPPPEPDPKCGFCYTAGRSPTHARGSPPTSPPTCHALAAEECRDDPTTPAQVADYDAARPRARAARGVAGSPPPAGHAHRPLRRPDDRRARRLRLGHRGDGGHRRLDDPGRRGRVDLPGDHDDADATPT